MIPSALEPKSVLERELLEVKHGKMVENMLSNKKDLSKTFKKTGKPWVESW